MAAIIRKKYGFSTVPGAAQPAGEQIAGETRRKAQSHHQ
jgi:hypothetical protein